MGKTISSFSTFAETGSVARFISRTFTAAGHASHNVEKMRERSYSRRQLEQLPDYILKDIGISRADAVREASKHFWEK